MGPRACALYRAASVKAGQEGKLYQSRTVTSRVVLIVIFKMTNFKNSSRGRVECCFHKASEERDEEKTVPKAEGSIDVVQPYMQCLGLKLPGFGSS